MEKKLDNEGITYYTLKWVEEHKKSEIAYYRQKIEQWDIIDNIAKVFKELTNSLYEIPTNGVILLWLRNFYIGSGKFKGIREYYQNQINNSDDKNISLKASRRLRDLCYYQFNEGLITFDEVQRITQNIKFENYVYKKNSKTVKILDEILYGYKQLTEYEKLLQQGGKTPKKEIDTPKSKISVPVWVLYYHYLMESRKIPYFNEYNGTKNEAIKHLLKEEGHNFSWKSFRNIYYNIGKRTAKDPLNKYNLKKVINLLDNGPAKELAENDFYSMS
jgi:hypothetical protein